MAGGRRSAPNRTGFHFTLLLGGADPLVIENQERLSAAGCGDGSFGRRGDSFFAEFDRPAKSFPGVVRGTIEALEGAVPGLMVTRIEPDEMVGVPEVALRLNRSQQSIRLLADGHRGPGGFPTPVAWVGQERRVWAWSEIVEWWHRYDGSPEDLNATEAQWIASANAALQIRRWSARLRQSPGARETHDWLVNLSKTPPYLEANTPAAILVHLPSWSDEDERFATPWFHLSGAESRTISLAVAVHDGVTRAVWKVERWQWRSEEPNASFEGHRINRGGVFEAFVGELGRRVPGAPAAGSSSIGTQRWPGDRDVDLATSARPKV